MYKDIELTISELSAIAHKNAVEKGFYDNEKRIGELLMLIVSELGEAQEADRKGHRCNDIVLSGLYNKINDSVSKGLGLSFGEITNEQTTACIRTFENEIKDTLEDEIADAVIRIFDMAGHLGLHLYMNIIAKMVYNSYRGKMHGKLY